MVEAISRDVAKARANSLLLSLCMLPATISVRQIVISLSFEKYFSHVLDDTTLVEKVLEWMTSSLSGFDTLKSRTDLLSMKNHRVE